MKKIIVLILTILLFGCSSNIKEDRIDRISIRSIGLGILYPVKITEESIRDLEAYEISNKDSIDLVKEYISKLEPSIENRIVEGNIYMVSDFYYKNKKLYTLRFDKGRIDFDGRVYKKNDTLIEILYRNKIRFGRN
ncbi:hypothetical protein [Winogradskyella sp.]|uniref:hypothetical protein n=1 Tax=Winogradskyella sp. TaxID=1883156 RepID=UPI0025D3479E|nr:hypothetical protein [Winogradskyella sp.]